MARGAPGLVMGPCIVEIDRIVIREVQYQLEVNRCRNEEVIVKGNFGWAWSLLAGCPRVGNGAMHISINEVNRCRNEEVNPHPNPITFDPGLLCAHMLFQGS
ncbi:hypothetical protein DPMN_144185 [Dreissena polymorpha]|uniref:Uncharacterized protein n=1 Tax=Dreissena polymorpha TaxID=45954 RepID=A0A9D4GIF6_DREPO|nr:hypothetical protein DPMN_144185 [Dreissena polymorpha]